MADWTPDLLEEARRLWTEGWSAWLIAEKLGMTKGQVIGRAHRLNWGWRPTTHERPNSLTERLRAIKLAKASARTHAAPKPPPPPPKPPKPRKKQGTYTLLDLRPHECKWPVNAPEKGGLYLFCGEPQFNGWSYCEYHSRVGFSGKGTARRSEVAGWQPRAEGWR